MGKENFPNEIIAIDGHYGINPKRIN